MRRNTLNYYISFVCFSIFCAHAHGDVAEYIETSGKIISSMDARTCTKMEALCGELRNLQLERNKARLEALAKGNPDLSDCIAILALNLENLENRGMNSIAFRSNIQKCLTQVNLALKNTTASTLERRSASPAPAPTPEPRIEEPAPSSEVAINDNILDYLHDLLKMIPRDDQIANGMTYAGLNAFSLKNRKKRAPILALSVETKKKLAAYTMRIGEKLHYIIVHPYKGHKDDWEIITHDYKKIKSLVNEG